ncbi:hypothetical protein P5G51_001120 [Virgibacillus sp. 179-BFC.A HS]|uniref:Uncharacterized protein n=1 Tax=Tigheibacillus jepli TaxID=3035914 RepID=A0ABU5CD45_9BACI|nr:hypothetical protein [Virgibacillus sp. 179-BFC.A HS]MDY0404191.1 hypothetical protein [Virgibacillus sp. 179-BFC.A HS]
MKKYSIIALCVVVIIGISSIFAVKYINNKDESENNYPLTTQQKMAIKNAKTSKKDLTNTEIDTFTIGQGKQLLDQYLIKHDLNYKVGSKKYINFLADISENRKYQNSPEFTIIDAYATVYLSELQKAEPYSLSSI